MTRAAVWRWLYEHRSPLARTERMLRKRSRVLRRTAGDRFAVEHYVEALETCAADLHVKRLSNERF